MGFFLIKVAVFAVLLIFSSFADMSYRINAPLKEDGMKYLAQDIQGIFPEIPVKFIPAGNPFWKP
jgi:hypothetical protein